MRSGLWVQSHRRRAVAPRHSPLPPHNPSHRQRAVWPSTGVGSWSICASRQRGHQRQGLRRYGPFRDPGITVLGGSRSRCRRAGMPQRDRGASGPSGTRLAVNSERSAVALAVAHPMKSAIRASECCSDDGSFEPGQARRIMSQAFSAIMMTGEAVLPDVIRGMIEASTMRRRPSPWTRRSGETTALSS